MLDGIGRRGDGRVIARGIETCHERWRRRLLDDFLNCYAMFCFVLSGEYHCNLCVRSVEPIMYRNLHPGDFNLSSYFTALQPALLRIRNRIFCAVLFWYVNIILYGCLLHWHWLIYVRISISGDISNDVHGIVCYLITKYRISHDKCTYWDATYKQKTLICTKGNWVYITVWHSVLTPMIYVCP